MFSWLIDAWFPPTCAGCGSEGQWICRVCMIRFQPMHDRCFGCRRPSGNGRFCFLCARAWPVVGVTAAGSYTEPVVRDTIHAMKYRYARILCSALAPFLESAIYLHGDAPHDPILVPLPLSRRRYTWRGFNQAALLAEGAGSRAGWPVAHVLTRVRHTFPQAELSHEERHANVAGAFRVQDRFSFEGRDVILIDDVATTGSTLRAAAEACRTAAAGNVYASVIAIG
ncbi:ComF family protein [Candidatus Uhrbacteria bacterium]|nr:ComF family protein [Candidatus Uhrbacteria bacterium]